MTLCVIISPVDRVAHFDLASYCRCKNYVSFVGHTYGNWHRARLGSLGIVSDETGFQSKAPTPTAFALSVRPNTFLVPSRSADKLKDV